MSRSCASLLVSLLLAVVLASMPVAADLEVFVSDGATANTPSDWKILRFDADGANPEVFTDDQLAWPQDIVFLEAEGEVLVSNLNSGRITRYDIETGDYLGNFATGISGPTRMRFGPDEKLYVLQWNGDLPVLRFERDGTALGGFTSTGVTRAIGMDWDSSGNLYVSSYGLATVRRFNTQGNDMGLFINSGLSGPTNIRFDDNGELLVFNWDGNSIARFSASGQALGLFDPAIGRPEGVARMPNGDWLIGNGADGSVQRYTASGQSLGKLISARSGGLVRPNAVVLRSTDSAGLTPTSALNDAWFNPPTSGQGFFINVFPDSQLIFVGWFTWETENRPAQTLPADLGAPYQRWLTAIGTWQGNVATLDVSNNSGGRFDHPQPTSITPGGTYGTMTIEFHDCASATVEYDLFAIGETGTIPIERIVGDNIESCEAVATLANRP